jgi:hypothetical protein
MDKELFRWHIKCDSDCKNKDGIMELIFVTDTFEVPAMSCSPCGGKPIDDITFLDSYTVTE